MNDGGHEGNISYEKHKGHKERNEGYRNHKEHKEHKEPKENNERDETHDEAPEPIAPEIERVIREAIGAAIDVHKELGPGFIEAVYHRALVIALRHRGLFAEEQKAIEIHYRGELVCRHRLDLVIENAVVVEVKAVRKLRPLHQAQILSYLKASRCRAGLLMNFNVPLLIDGLRRFVR